MTAETLAPALTPVYCRICGSRLESSSRTVEFDPYTGEPVKSDSLFCNNLTTVTNTKKFGQQEVKQTPHPRWALSNGEWTER